MSGLLSQGTPAMLQKAVAQYFRRDAEKGKKKNTTAGYHRYWFDIL
ncbi:MAG: hypothetical protein ABIL58_14865 [Pseudomonadota bacterium]